MRKKNYFYNSILKGKQYPMLIPHIRSFSTSHTIFFPSDSRLPATSVARFSNSTDDIRSFVDRVLLRDLESIEQLNHTIQFNDATIRYFYSNQGLNTNTNEQIEVLTDLIEQDTNERRLYEQSAELISAISQGEEPPIHNMEAWLNLRNDLDNNQDLDLQTLREYVEEIINTNIGDQFIERAMDVIMRNRENLTEFESRDNSQYSDEIEESISASESNSVYHSANSNHYESTSNDSDSNYNPLTNDQGLNIDDNLSNLNNESNSNLDEYYDSNEYNSNTNDTDLNKSDEQNKSNLTSNEKYITDDALDISDTLHMFYEEPSTKNESTIDFVLQKQQEEMPDIMDSDGGE